MLKILLHLKEVFLYYEKSSFEFRILFLIELMLAGKDKLLNSV